ASGSSPSGSWPTPTARSTSPSRCRSTQAPPRSSAPTQDTPPTPTTSYVEVDGIRLTVERIARAGGPHFAKPLVLAFLNGCATAPPATWTRDSVAGFLCFAGHRRVACVTSFAEVPSAFASGFAQRFWAGFLAGRTVGEALQEARRGMLEGYNNPLGLLYA